MKVLAKIQSWGDQHHPKWLDVFRIILGVVLVWKGVSFILNLHALRFFLIESHIDDKLGLAISISLLAHLIIALHLIGGVCIALGTNTRLCCLLNLPVLIGAVFLVNLQLTLFRPYAEFGLSVVVLLGLICFLVEGNGVLLVKAPKQKAI
ncbi:DoxX family membrane protein [Mucilaginibacter robiniae]|uniref:DoxX family membrane protein n=1 Tax=Mucilaginibacter robiniae TaxID=2728022 RepID=A0A7L5DVL3_9SPHI|nr:DoxX family membrane protein [Mucilaginibacter robiniae]QJD95130.1 DoxX family membrane protein [Mucilaginibacter robiniae]